MVMTDESGFVRVEESWVESVFLNVPDSPTLVDRVLAALDRVNVGASASKACPENTQVLTVGHMNTDAMEVNKAVAECIKRTRKVSQWA